MSAYLDLLMFAAACLVLLMGFPVAFTLAGVALAFGLRHEQVSTSPIGMKSPEEVDQVCDAVIASKTLFDDAFWEDFSDAFDGKVSALERKDHWYYDKVTSKIA